MFEFNSTIIKMITKLVLLIVFAGFVVCVVQRNNLESPYTVPKPLIRIFRPSGFSVSIADSPGIELFAVHANINKPLEFLKAGQFSRDILRKENGFWTLTDTRTELVKGDTIYFWLYVIKNHLGYRLDDGIFQVKEKDIVDRKDVGQSGTNSSSLNNVENGEGTEQSSPEQENDTFSSRICQDTLLNVSRTLVNLQSRLQLLSDRNDILREIVQKFPEATKSLTLTGTFPNDEPLLVVRDFLRQKLHSTIKPTEANREANSKIIFKVDTLDDKITVLEAAKLKLSNSKFQISP